MLYVCQVRVNRILTKLIRELTLATLPSLSDSLDSRWKHRSGGRALVLALCDSVCVAMGDVEAEVNDGLKGKLTALFKTVRNGVSLTGALIAALVTFYTTVMMVESDEEVAIPRATWIQPVSADRSRIQLMSCMRYPHTAPSEVSVLRIQRLSCILHTGPVCSILGYKRIYMYVSAYVYVCSIRGSRGGGGGSSYIYTSPSPLGATQKIWARLPKVLKLLPNPLWGAAWAPEAARGHEHRSTTPRPVPAPRGASPASPTALGWSGSSTGIKGVHLSRLKVPGRLFGR